MRRIIREEDPPSPSTRLSTLGQSAVTVSAERQSDPKRLCRLLRGELDWIVMKALEKDRNRRYESANELRAGCRSLLARRAGGRLPAVDLVSLPQVHAAVHEVAGNGGADPVIHRVAGNRCRLGGARPSGPRSGP